MAAGEAGRGGGEAVCVLIPVFADPDGLARTLAALGQDPFPMDVLVVDDGSPVPVACPPGCAGPHRVSLLRLDPNRGIEHALNAGLEAALGRGHRYVARIDAGDLPLGDRFARQAAFLDAHPEVGILGTWAECVDEAGRYLFTLRFPADHHGILRRQRYAPGLLHPTVMIRAAILPEVGPYSDRYKAAEDYDLFARIGRRHGMANLPEVLTRYVVSARGTSLAKRRRTLLSRLGVQAAHFRWSDPHAWLGVARTLVFLGLPVRALIAVKRLAWR